MHIGRVTCSIFREQRDRAERVGTTPNERDNCIVSGLVHLKIRQENAPKPEMLQYKKRRLAISNRGWDQFFR